MSMDINRAKQTFSEFLRQYDSREPGFQLKASHTFHVTENAGTIASLLNCSEEDTELAELIGLLHDIGRFEELRVTHELNNLSFDHAAYGVKMLFEDGLIRQYLSDDRYDEIIRKAILYHSRKELPEGLSERELLHAAMIRDADKLDNFRVKIEEPAENLFPGRVNSLRDMEEGTISDQIYTDLTAGKTADIHDRVTPLDYYACIFGFAFDLNFSCTKRIVREKEYIERMAGRFVYRKEETARRMEEITRCVLRHLGEEQLT